MQNKYFVLTPNHAEILTRCETIITSSILLFMNPVQVKNTKKKKKKIHYDAIKP